jgi:hypothetical protein
MGKIENREIGRLENENLETNSYLNHLPFSINYFPLTLNYYQFTHFKKHGTTP